MKLRGIDNFLFIGKSLLLRAGSAARNLALKIIRRAGSWLSAVRRLIVFPENGIPRERYRFFAGTAVLLVCFAVNIVMTGQADMPFPLGAAMNKNLVFTQWWEHDDDTGILKSLINEFSGQNPNIRITLDTRPYTAIRDILFQAGDSPGDILGLDPRWFDEPAVTERLEPLARYRSVDRGGFPAAGEGPGREWGIPLVSFMSPLFYNIDLLEEAGFDRPPKNQADFTAAAAAVSAMGGRYGFGIGLSPEDPHGLYRDILPWIPYPALPEDGDSPSRFGAAELTQALEFLDKLRREGSLAPGSFAKTGKDRVAEFGAGRTAMLFASMLDARPLRGIGFRIGVTSVPRREAYTGKPLYTRDQWYVGISQNSKYKDEALLFIRFLAGQRAALSAYWGAVPWDDTSGPGGAEDDPLLSKAHDIYNAGEARPEYSGWQMSLFEQVMTEELRRMLEAGQSPQDTAANIQQRLEADG